MTVIGVVVGVILVLVIGVLVVVRLIGVARADIEALRFDEERL